MKTKCAQCGKKSKKNHKFCVECGTLLPEEIIAPELVKCSGCGDSISASIKFCNKCGVQLSGEEEHIKKGKRNKPLRRKITGIALLSLLILIVLTIGVYIGAGFLFKHEIVEIE
ncbi:MAG: zinc ribbon domain-containing protein, partial [Clostridiales bacterium]|nr:zinc ribbon domain-containing protein [Clostridiales bacterium]